MNETREKMVKREYTDITALQEIFESLQDVLLQFQSITSVCMEERRRQWRVERGEKRSRECLIFIGRLVLQTLCC